MLRNFLYAKIHRARLTQADLNYVGSITIDAELLRACDILPNERVQIVNNNNGARLETYVIPGEAGSGVICLNGSAARLAQVGDILIIMAYVWCAAEEAPTPRIVLLDEHNRIQRRLNAETPGLLV